MHKHLNYLGITVSIRRLAAALTIACLAMSAHAQTAAPRGGTDPFGVMTTKNTEVLPVWNNHSGKVEALLLLQPAPTLNGSALFGAGARVNTGHGFVQGDVSFEKGNGLALLCNSTTGLVTLGSLAGRCLVTSLDEGNNPFLAQPARAATATRAEVRFTRPESLFALSAGQADFDTTANDWLSPNSGLLPGLGILGGHVSSQDVSASGRMNIGDKGWVSIGGTLARAQLIPAAGQTGAEAQHWNSTSVGVAVGRGKLSGEVIGRVVDLPGQPSALSTLGVGFSWQTPWKGSLSFGAEKSTGNTPAAKAGQTDEGTVPYVRYHQDL
ncbi:MAG: hypothetical protein JSS03_06080 [Proteobacteria bacterium]|nr:hypothetical protein [Pseudomonadota bacterium]